MIIWHLLKVKLFYRLPEMMDAAKKVLERLMDEDSEIITIIYGEDATAEQADELQNFIEENYPDAEVEIVEGKQSLLSIHFICRINSKQCVHFVCTAFVML